MPGTRSVVGVGEPWESGPAIVGLDLVSLFLVGESIVGLISEGGSIVRA